MIFQLQTDTASTPILVYHGVFNRRRGRAVSWSRCSITENVMQDFEESPEGVI